MIDQQVPDSVRPVLESYAALAQQKCPGLICAFYIVGSIALGGYDERFSDIDFVAVLSRKASQGDLDSLMDIHSAIERNFPKSKLSGSYLQRQDLGKFEDEIAPHPYYQDGKFHATGYFEINSFTWWILKNHGIPIWGDEPRNLPFMVNWDLLLTNMKENLNSYWAGWTKRPQAFLMMLSDWGIQWVVLGILRQYFTFRESSIVTKLAAAKYALGCLPVRWYPLIQEAIDIRDGQKRRHYHSRILRMIDAVKFLNYVIQRGNEIFPNKKPPRSGGSNSDPILPEQPGSLFS